MHATSLFSFLPLGAMAFPQAPASTPAATTAGATGGLGSLFGGLFGGAKPNTAPAGPVEDITTTTCKTHDPANLSLTGAIVESIFGGPNGPLPDEKCMKDDSGGSGPWKANYTEDATLPNHTIYAPKTPPPDSEKLPLIVWGNGACMGVGTMFYNFLNEIASHGFVIIANGKAVGAPLSGMETYKDLMTSIDWALTNPAAKKYGNIDTSRIVAAGQSCGGLEAVSS
jgi:hypothetical protein